MIRRSSRLVLSIAVALLSFGAAPVRAQDSGGDSAAVAINTKDGSSIFRLAFHVHRTMSDVVDESDVAVAHASCEDCRTVAVAIQVVLVMSDPSVVTPENIALAVNQECVSCETLASAYQYVLGTDGAVRFDAEGNRELAEIRHALVELRKSSAAMTVQQIQAEVDLLVDELHAVLDEHLVAVGSAEDADTGAEAGGPEATPEPATDAPSDPGAGDVTPSPEPLYSTEPSSEPEPSYSPEPESSPTSGSNSPEPEPSGSP
jgi:putative peptide zinc metalloprotease protein